MYLLAKNYSKSKKNLSFQKYRSDSPETKSKTDFEQGNTTHKKGMVTFPKKDSSQVASKVKKYFSNQVVFIF